MPALRTVCVMAAAVLVSVLAAIAVAVWPVTACLALTVAVILLLAWRAPALGLGAAVLLFGFEGSVKILLGLEPTPLPGGARAAGAAALDIALFGAVAGVVMADRLRTPRALWARATRAERWVAIALGAWIALSVLEIATGGRLSRGVQGFRLFQAYSVMAVAAAIVFADSRTRARRVQAALAIGLAISLYAAARVVLGPAAVERAFALSVDSTTTYGSAIRAIGSFSSAVGLTSFLAPLAAFGLVLGYLDARVRLLSFAVAAASMVGLIGSYSRASLFGVALGLLCALFFVLVAADMPARRKLAAAGLVAGLLLLTYGGVQVASHASPQLRERAKGILHPLQDESVKLRLATWKRAVQTFTHQPLGGGVGTVGSASAPDRAHYVTTDNSYLKVLLEQGVPGILLFAGGLLALLVVVVRRLRSVSPDARTLGLAAMTGFITFLGISISGEYVEQPGKVVAWALLGIAVVQALGADRAPAAET